jgi:hypothetical protein
MSESPRQQPPAEIKTPNDGADYWRNYIGVEALPANSREKKPYVPILLPSWKKYQNVPSTDKEFQFWIDRDAYRDGVCILTGKVRHRPDRANLYYVVIDADKSYAIKELLTRNGYTPPTLQEVSKQWIVEQHKDNKDKAHFGFYSPIRFPEKASDQITGIQVRCEDNDGKTNRVVIVSPSIHKDNYPYEIIGTKDPIVLTELQARELIQHINQICVRNGIEYLIKIGTGKLNEKLKRMIKKLIIDNSIEIRDGDRNNTLIAVADSILIRHSSKHSEEYLRKFFDDVNEQYCISSKKKEERN